MFLSTAVTASAKKVEADLRVSWSGKMLAEQTLKTGPAKIPTSSRATCFGPGTGGSGRAKKVGFPTALGLLSQAAGRTKALRPLLITDSFSFGLGICGVGGHSATEELSWYLKVNHRNPELGGEAVRLKRGDEVLWALAAFPYPNELALEAKGRAVTGSPFKVRVLSYDDKGKRRPVEGAWVNGAVDSTNARGVTTVTIARPKTIRARHGKDIPSNGLRVCGARACR